jgi:polyisoprenoid-binding protein YceI
LAALFALLLPAVSLHAAPRTFVVDSAASSLHVRVGKAGLFKFAGHEHDIVAGRLSGTVVADADDIGRSSVTLEIDAGALSVSGVGEPAEDVPQVQEIMRGPRVLDAARFAVIGFRSQTVTGRRLDASGAYQVQVAGQLTLRGVTRPIELSLRVDLASDQLSATGKTTLRQTDFGVEPVSAGGGTVKVKDDLEINWKIVARRSPD